MVSSSHKSGTGGRDTRFPSLVSFVGETGRANQVSFLADLICHSRCWEKYCHKVSHWSSQPQYQGPSNASCWSYGARWWCSYIWRCTPLSWSPNLQFRHANPVRRLWRPERWRARTNRYKIQKERETYPNRASRLLWEKNGKNTVYVWAGNNMGRHTCEEESPVCRRTPLPAALIYLLRCCGFRVEKPEVIRPRNLIMLFCESFSDWPIQGHRGCSWKAGHMGSCCIGKVLQSTSASPRGHCSECFP